MTSTSSNSSALGLYSRAIGVFLQDLSKFYTVYDDTIESLLIRAETLEPKEWRELYEISNIIRDLKSLRLTLNDKYVKYRKRYTNRFSSLQNIKSIDYYGLFQKQSAIQNIKNNLKEGILDINFKVKLEAYSEILNTIAQNISRESVKVKLRPINIQGIVRSMAEGVTMEPFTKSTIDDMVDAINIIKLQLNELLQKKENKENELRNLEERSDVIDTALPEDEDGDTLMNVNKDIVHTISDIPYLTDQYTKISKQLENIASRVTYIDDSVQAKIDAMLNNINTRFSVQPILTSIEELKSTIETQTALYQQQQSQPHNTEEDKEASNRYEEIEDNIKLMKLYIKNLDDNYKEVYNILTGKSSTPIVTASDTETLKELKTIKTEIYNTISTNIQKSINSVIDAVNSLSIPSTEELQSIQNNIISKLTSLITVNILNEANISNIITESIKKLNLQENYTKAIEEISIGFNNYRMQVESNLEIKNNALDTKISELSKVQDDSTNTILKLFTEKIEQLETTTKDQAIILDTRNANINSSIVSLNTLLDIYNRKNKEFYDKLETTLNEFKVSYNIDHQKFKDTGEYIESIKRKIEEELNGFSSIYNTLNSNFTTAIERNEKLAKETEKTVNLLQASLQESFNINEQAKKLTEVIFQQKDDTLEKLDERIKALSAIEPSLVKIKNNLETAKTTLIDTIDSNKLQDKEFRVKYSNLLTLYKTRLDAYSTKLEEAVKAVSEEAEERDRSQKYTKTKLEELTRAQENLKSSQISNFDETKQTLAATEQGIKELREFNANLENRTATYFNALIDQTFKYFDLLVKRTLNQIDTNISLETIRRENSTRSSILQPLLDAETKHYQYIDLQTSDKIRRTKDIIAKLEMQYDEIFKVTEPSDIIRKIEEDRSKSGEQYDKSFEMGEDIKTRTNIRLGLMHFRKLLKQEKVAILGDSKGNISEPAQKKQRS
ncbi:hypothetical protein PmNV_080 [Penaeus monodon nudivirus]|uniref:Uncharacterized protein n=1 Tax=Penaeus monodon nudivirus TaxID=1529056 RepID=A0A076FD53_9VIRU|nr:hypothetical protein PmNV_080 [Penaeus monodon nudivirus]AII15868.1 hypothetical protein PmNV_080 [Penaeus monodon nudivirus]